VVAIRARKPWVRFRLMFEGWKVRFTKLSLEKYLRSVTMRDRSPLARKKKAAAPVQSVRA